MIRRIPLAAILALASTSSTLHAQALIEDFVPVTDEMLQNPDPSDWLMWRRTLNSWGYSPLEKINDKNVGRKGCTGHCLRSISYYGRWPLGRTAISALTYGKMRP